MRFIVIHTPPARILFAIMGGRETKISFGVAYLIDYTIGFITIAHNYLTTAKKLKLKIATENIT